MTQIPSTPARTAWLTQVAAAIEHLQAMAHAAHRNSARILVCAESLAALADVDIDDIRDAVYEYQDIARGDYTADEYHDARTEAWDAIADAVDALDEDEIMYA